jgi:hypothetical protein
MSCSMNCKDVDRALSEESRVPLQAQDHVRSCNSCQELVRLLNSSVAVDPPSPATVRQMAEGMATNLRPVRPVPPARYFFGAFVGIFFSVVALGVYRMGAFAIAVMTPLETSAILSALAISTGLLAYSLVLQMVPGSRHRIPPGLLPIGITISLAIAIAALFQFQHERNFWGDAWACIQAGAPLGLLAAVPFWLILRQGAILSPGMTGAATGLLAGLVGTSVLQIHCPNLDAWHILVSHLGAAMLCALAGLVIGLAVEVKAYAANSPFKRELQGDIK